METIKRTRIAKRILISIMTMILIVSCILSMKQIKDDNSIIANQELLRAMTYEQFEDGDENVEGTDNVKFSAFFLRDLDGDGYAEKIKGTCKEIGKEDTLYMEINVQTSGYLKDGKIQINGNNYYMQTSLPKDNELKESYIGNNIKSIEFENLSNGTQKMLTGIVRSGDYTYSSQRTIAIGNNINNYSRDDNTIVLTGTYVSEEGTETEIRKEIPHSVDWYGTAVAKLYTLSSYSDGTQVYHDIDSRIDEEKGFVTLDFYLYPTETKKDLNLSYNYTCGEIPELNGYAPISVNLINGTGEFMYDENTRKFSITRTSEVDSNGRIISSISSNLNYGIKVVYPIEAYTVTDDEEITISVPVSTCFKGYNNPNDGFQNPYVSPTASATIVANYKKPQEYYSSAYAEIKVGRYTNIPYSRYYISKNKPLKIYNGTSPEEKEDYYKVQWSVNTGTKEEYERLILKETPNELSGNSDTFIKSNSTEDSMEDITTNVGIYFEKNNSFLKQDGEIKVYDVETDDLVVTFTKDGGNGTEKWNIYSSTNPYYYEVPIKHVRIEITTTNPGNTLDIFNIKELDDKRIVEKYEREQFDNLKYIKSNLVVYGDEKLIASKSHQAIYEEPYSIANLSINKSILTTQSTEEDFEIDINVTQNAAINQMGWKNGLYLVKLPDEILTTEIKSVATNDYNVRILSYELIEKNGHHFIKIQTSNDEPLGYSLTIRTSITPDPRIATVSERIELYAINEETNQYCYNNPDIYDVNNNGNVNELVNYRSTSISLVSPNSLLTNQTISEFDEIGTIIVSPQVAELKPIYSEEDREKQTVKIGIQLKNNYSSTISEAKILGKIPFEGNSYVVSGRNLNSEYTTEMSDVGIEAPIELKDKVTIYYSEIENPSKDLNDSENGWTLKDNVEDFSKIRTYLIDLNDTVINVGAEYTFYYTVKIPFGVEFNKVAYSHHGIYFSLDTPEGKYRTQTEPNKIGVRIADKFDLELTKYQIGTNKKVEGATYKVTKLNDEGEIEYSQTAITNSEGMLEMANLYAEKVYEIVEISTPKNYELNSDVIGIIGHVNRSTGQLTIEKLYGDTKNEIIVIKNENEDCKVKIDVEDEVRASLKITKIDKSTDVPIRDAKFRITGPGYNSSGRIVTTNSFGKIELSGISIGNEYTIEETNVEGYYLAQPIIFKIENDNGTYESEILSGEAELDLIMTENDFPVLDLEIEDEAIPRYNLELTKIKHITEVEEGNGENNNQEITYLQGAKFKLYKEGKELGTYITNEYGKLTIENLYQYEEERGVDQTYVLKEVLPPEGYTKVKDITFKVSNILGVLNYEETLQEGQSDKDYTIEGNTIKITVEDNPAFKLIKKDGETGQVLPNTKFAIYNVDNGLEPARNTKGELIGEKERINEQDYYIIKTDSNGEITADLPEGFYKAVEIEASDERYDIEGKEYYFGIGTSREQKQIYIPKTVTSVGGKSIEYINATVLTEDGGYIVGGEFSSSSLQVGDYTYTNQGGYNGLIIKYNRIGEVEWSTSIEGTGSENVKSILVTEDEGYIVIGEFSSPSIQIGNNTLNSIGTYDAFVARYSKIGEVEWAYSFGGSYNEHIYAASITKDGGYIIGGAFSSRSMQIGDYIISSNGSSDAFLVKFNNIGEVEWAKSSGGTVEERINSIAITEDGGYLVSKIVENRDYTDTPGGVTVSSNAFIVKYDKDGEVEWETSFEGTNIDYINSIAVTEDDGYIVGGSFEGASIIIGEYTLNNNGYGSSTDTFLAKFDSRSEVEWVTSFGGYYDDSINSISVTEDGGFAVVGNFASESIQVGDYRLVNSNSARNDVFVVKYNDSGKVVWGTSFGDNGNDSVRSVTTKEDEYIVIGYFESSNIQIGNNLLNSQGSIDSFIVKYGGKEVPEVVFNNVNSIVGDNGVLLTSVAATIDGGYIAVGYFSDPSIQLGDYILNNNSNNSYNTDSFIAKYNNRGEIEWAKAFGGNKEERTISVAVSNAGEYIVGGIFTSTTMEVGEYTLSSNGNYDAYVVKFDNKGDVKWASSFGGANSDYIESITVTKDDSYILGGYFSSSAMQVGEYTLTSNNQDAFVVKYNNNGNVEWAKSFKGSTQEQIDSVASTEDGGCIAGGRFLSSTLQVGTYTLINNKDDNSSDAFIIKFDSNGEVEWAQSFGGTSNDYINSVAVSEDGGYFVGGYGYSTDMQIGEDILTNNSAFVIKFKNTGEVEWVNSFNGNRDNHIQSIAPTEDGGYIAAGYFNSNKINVGDYQLVNYNKNTYASDAFIVKCDNKGNVEWTTSFGEESSDYIYSVAVLKYGGYIVGGFFYSSRIQIGDHTLINGGSDGSADAFLLNINAYMGALEQEMLTINNERKEYKITTDVKEIDGIKGGIISGEDNSLFEIVKHGDSSIEPIIMMPDENYEIIDITVNGKDWNYVPKADGSYMMPTFENIQEDKHIVVTFAKKDNKISINKIDSHTNDNIGQSGIKFKLDQLEEREEPLKGDVLGDLTNNGRLYWSINENDEISGVLGTLTNNGTYYFEEQNDGNGNISYVPTNSKTWQVANVEGATEGVQSSTAHSYIPIDLSGLNGKYKVVVNAECSTQSGYDYGFVRVTENTDSLSYQNSTGRFVYISGIIEAKDIESTVVLDGGKVYYLHLGYYKNGSKDIGEDQIKINSIKIYSAREKPFGFIENNGKYESTNQGKDSTVCNSYIPIDLTTYQGKYNLIVNAEISSQYNDDYGYVTITQNTDRPAYNTYTGRIIYISGSKAANDYETVLEGGNLYYLHMGYYKNGSISANDDKFTINSISLTLNDSDLYHTEVETNSEGQAITQIPFGKYAITEIIAPDGYILNEIPTVIEFREGGNHEFTIENDKKCNVIVHHYIKGTTTKVADDELIQGKEGDYYSTIPKVDLLNYELEKDDNSEYILPNNYIGEFTYEDKEVIYNYVPKGTLLTVHHYIEGTQTEVPLKDGTLAETEYIVGTKGTRYETNRLTEEELNDSYTYSNVNGETSGVYGDNEIIVTYYYKKAQNTLIINKFEEDGVTPLEGAEFAIGGIDDNMVVVGDMTNNGAYYFIKQGDKYISNNQGKNNSVANSYIIIDMTYAKEDAKVIVNAEISSESRYDYGYARLIESSNNYPYNNTIGRFIFISGNVNASDYEAILEKGKKYYLHLGYRKDSSNYDGNDIFTINSIRIEGANVAKVFKTNAFGKIEESLDVGEYQISEIQAPYGYITPNEVVGNISLTKQTGASLNITNERKMGQVIVGHYDYDTGMQIAENDIIEKKVFERYDTNANESLLDKYTLVSEPTNKSGTVSEEDTYVDYYYRRNTGRLNISKVDKDTREPLEGVKFGVYEGDYKNIALDDAMNVGNVHYNITADKTDESDVIIGEPYAPDESARFVKIDGKFIPINCIWYKNRENDTSTLFQTAVSYIDIDLRDKNENDVFVLTTNVDMRNTTDDMVYYQWFDGEDFGRIEQFGEKNESYDTALIGGKKYSLGITYNRGFDFDQDTEDYVAAEMKLYNTQNGIIEMINEVPTHIEIENLKNEENIGSLVLNNNSQNLGFSEVEGKYLPQNSQTYIDEYGGDSGYYANTAIEIDLSDKEGYYAIAVNAETHGFAYDESLYACINDILEWKESFIEIYEDTDATNYYKVLNGGKKYYLMLNYEKFSGTDVKDYAAINSIKLYNVDVKESVIGFDKTSDGKYISNNKGINNSTAHAIIPIDLRNINEPMELTVNAEISSERWNDDGIIRIMDDFDWNYHFPDYFYELFIISGEVGPQDYTVQLEGGRMYYLHMSYHKNNGDYDNVGNDTFTINEIKVESKKVGEVNTDENGFAEITLPTDNYSLVEYNSKEGYEPIEPQKITLTRDGLDVTIENEKKKGKVTVNHFVEGTENNITDYDGVEVVPEIMKDVYGASFETHPITNLNDKYELVEMPDKTSGEYGEEDQIITYYYRLKKYPYIVNYLLKDNDDDDSNNVVLSPQKSNSTDYDYGTIIDAEDEKININGYLFNSANTEHLKITANNNVLNLYYIVDDGNTKELSYTVEYYKDNVKVDEDTITRKSNVQVLEPDTLSFDKSLINDNDKYYGYKLNSTDPTDVPDIVNSGDIIKVYYVKDDSQTKELSYTVEYYKDNIKVDDDTITRKTNVQVLEPDTLSFDRSLINDSDKYYGYKLNSTDPTDVPDIVNNGDIIKVYYIIDEVPTKELRYTIEYYKDNVLQENDTETINKVVPISENDTLDVNKSLINTTNRYDDYTFEKTNPEIIPNTIENGGVIKVYYVRTKYPYRVEYYYNGIIDEAMTENGENYKDEIIDKYDDKVKDGYVFEEVVGLPMTISADGENIIKVYYSPIRKIIIDHIDKNTGDIIKVEEKSDKEGNTTTTKPLDLEGYTIVERPESEEFTFKEDEQVAKYYYAKNTQVVVKYVDEETGEELVTSEIINGYVGKGYTTEQKKVDGYNFISNTNNIEGKMTEEGIEVIYYYNKTTEISNSKYSINYIDKDTGKPIKDAKIAEQKIGTTIYAKAEIEDIEGYTFDHFDKDSIIIEEKNNTITLYYTKDNEKKETNDNEKTNKDDKSIVKPTIKEDKDKNTIKVSNTEKNEYTNQIVGFIFIIVGSLIIIIDKIKIKHKD